MLQAYAIERVLERLPKSKAEKFISEQLENQEYLKTLKRFNVADRLSYIFLEIETLSSGQELLEYQANNGGLEGRLPQFGSNFDGQMAFFSWFFEECRQYAPRKQQEEVLENYLLTLRTNPVTRLSCWHLIDLLDTLLGMYQRPKGYFSNCKSAYENCEEHQSRVIQAFQYDYQQLLMTGYEAYFPPMKNPQSNSYAFFKFYSFIDTIKFLSLTDKPVRVQITRLISEQCHLSHYGSKRENVATSKRYLSNERLRQLLQHKQLEELEVGSKKIVTKELTDDALWYNNFSDDEVLQLVTNLDALYAVNKVVQFGEALNQVLNYLALEGGGQPITSVDEAFKILGITSEIGYQTFLHVWDTLVDQFKTDYNTLTVNDYNRDLVSEATTRTQQFQRQFLAYRYLYEHHQFPNKGVSVTADDLTQEKFLAALALLNIAVEDWTALPAERIHWYVKKASLLYHADKVGSGDKDAAEKFLKLPAAEELLKKIRERRIDWRQLPLNDTSKSVITRVPEGHEAPNNNDRALMMVEQDLIQPQRQQVQATIEDYRLKAQKYIDKRTVFAWVVANKYKLPLFYQMFKCISGLRVTKVEAALAFLSALQTDPTMVMRDYESLLEATESAVHRYKHEKIQKQVEKQVEYSIKHNAIPICFFWRFHTLTSNELYERNQKVRDKTERLIHTDGQFYQCIK